MADEKPLKSALDIAMERFRKDDEASGVEKRPLTDAQKAAIGEARNFCEAKLAEQEVLHQSRMRQERRPRRAGDDGAGVPPRSRALHVRTRREDRKDQGAMTAQFPSETSTDGAFVRQRYTIRDRITADGSSGFPAEPGRYHLYVSLACPWAHRAIIVRRLLGLESTVSMSVVDPIRDERGWAFREGPGHGADPVCGFQFLSEAYLRTDPSFTGRYTVPCIWDRVTGRLVTNNYPDITIDFETAFTAFHRAGAPDLYPEHLRPEIDEHQRAGLRRRQQRCVQGRLRGVTGGLRSGGRPALQTAGLAGGSAGRPALSGRRSGHRSGHQALHDAGPLRRRVLRPLQVQSAAHRRLPATCGATRATCISSRGSARRSTSITSSATTT